MYQAEGAPAGLRTLPGAAVDQFNLDWSRAFGHQTVLGPEAADGLAIRPDGVYVDGTLGGGGHSRLILEALGPRGRLIALDQDPEPLEWAAAGWGKTESRLMLISGNFEALPVLLKNRGISAVDGILLDLGLSSRQLLTPGRGFSWAGQDRLDMRLDPTAELTAWTVVNRYAERNLADLIFQFGGERASRRIARAIVRSRPLETTGELADLVARTLWRPGRPPRIHPATRTFMALRIEVNGELRVLANFLAEAPDLIKSGGRLVVISFHSLEDRLVKDALRGRNEIWRPLFKKPLVPGPAEAAVNPRSRSAKLRAAERL